MGGGAQIGSGRQGEGGGVWGDYLNRDQYWFRGELAPVPGRTRMLPPHACGEAGKRIGSLCAVEVEGLISAAHPRRWAAQALSLGRGLGPRVDDLGFGV